MQAKKIKVGQWYETSLGYGECVSSGGTFPPSAQIVVRFPIPRGKCTMRPRDVLRELGDREAELMKQRIAERDAATQVKP